MANTSLDIRQSVYRPTPNMIGNGPNMGADAVLGNVDAEMGKLFEDRNVLLAASGTLTFTGTSLTFQASSSADLELHLNSLIAGGSPKVIVLATQSTTVNFASSGVMWYAIVNRTAGTATLSTGSTLPAVTNGNQEVFLIAKRVDDAVSSIARLYFRNGFVMDAGSTLKLGASAGGTSFDPTTILTSGNGSVLVNASGNVLIA